MREGKDGLGGKRGLTLFKKHVQLSFEQQKELKISLRSIIVLSPLYRAFGTIAEYELAK